MSRSTQDEDDDVMSTESPNAEGFEDLLRFVRDARGFDFTGYKRASLLRRVQRRMQQLDVETVADYHALLEADVDEFAMLFNTILINVTAFFRDPAAWQYVEAEIVPSIISRLDSDQPIRLWSAGCASGQEAYTLAMVMANALGVAAAARRVKIYGTDVDLDALAQARSGVYSDALLDEVPVELRSRYFHADARGRGFAMIPALRRTVVFGRHDLTRDPPISHVDLLSCRNTLMYLNSEVQAVVVPRLHYALKGSGYLFLGRAEMVIHGDAGRFESVSMKHRVFRALPQQPPPDSSPSRLTSREPFDLGPIEALPPDKEMSNERPEATFQLGAVAQLLVSPAGELVGANETARGIFAIDLATLSRPLRELRVTVGLEQLVEAVEQASAGRVARDLGVLRFVRSTGEEFILATQVFPILNERNEVSGVSVTLTDVGNVSSLHEDFQQVHAELETAYEELQSTNEELVTSNEELQSSYEELETTNEELQSANEELETTNEELRSSNEELETTNIELKSTSQELERTNVSLTDANGELNRFSTLHRHVMDNFPSAVIVLDSHLLIEEWNRAATDLWGLREDEVLGEPFFGLQFGLPLGELQDPVRACRSPGAPTVTLELQAINRLGRKIGCRVSVVCATDKDVPPSAMLIMDTMNAKSS
jgi:two-component system, chemotaxis family, CheB/CheR fusion protein